MWRGRDIHLVVQRARIVLQAHEGRGTEEIARTVGWTSRAVRKWKARFESSPALETLNDAARSGRPSTVPLSIRCQLVRLACERPNHEIMRFRDVWTYASLSDVLGGQDRVPPQHQRDRPHPALQGDPPASHRAVAALRGPGLPAEGEGCLRPLPQSAQGRGRRLRRREAHAGSRTAASDARRPATTAPFGTSTSTSGTAPRCCWRPSISRRARCSGTCCRSGRRPRWSTSWRRWRGDIRRSRSTSSGTISTSTTTARTIAGRDSTPATAGAFTSSTRRSTPRG